MQTTRRPCTFSRLTLICAAVLFSGVSSRAANSGSVTFSPSALSFSSQTVGTSSSQATITFKNNRAKALTISSVSSNSPEFVESTNCPIRTPTLAAGASCSIYVIFSPKSTGTRTGKVNVADNGPGSPQAVSLSGTGTSPVLTAIAVTPASASLSLGAAQQFTATGTYSNGALQDITKSATWTSSASSIATVASGLAQGRSAGTAVISASLKSISGSATLTVTPPAVLSIAVSPANASIAKGSTQQFIATATYSDSSTGDVTSSCGWSSSSATIATVSASGAATGIGIGSTSITATLGATSGSTLLDVSAPILQSIAITPPNASFALGTTQPLHATGTYSDGSTLDLTTTAVWNAADSSVATVDSSGIATSHAVGVTNISAAVGSVSGSTSASVTPAALHSLAITPALPTVAVGLTQQFTATGTFTDGTVQDLTLTVQWTSDNVSSATVTPAGLATAVNIGTANVSATSGSVSSSAVMTVSPAVLESLSISPTNSSVPSGTTQQFTAMGTFSDGTTQDLTSTTAWTSDSDLVKLSATGLATTSGSGSATITATSAGVSGSTSLTITAAELVSIAIAPQDTSVPLGMTQQFTATGTYTDGTVGDITATGHWSSSDASKATVSDSPPTVGLATCVGVGQAAIEITSGNVSATATLSVTAAALTAITITPRAATIPLGSSQQFSASGTFSDGTAQDTTSMVQWSSSDSGIAVLSNDPGSAGLATSAAQGTASITATWQGVTSWSTLTVTQGTLVSVQVTPATSSLLVGGTEQFIATGTYSDGSIQDVTASVLWTTDNPSVASIGTAGLASALATGTTNVIATFGSVTGSASLVVTAPLLLSIAVTPGTYLIPTAATVQLHALGTYSDGSTQDISSAVAWSSSAGAASVSTSGLVTALSPGTATITATAGGLTATAAVTSGNATSASYFGMHIQNVSNWPSANIGALAKGIGTSWNYMEPSPGVYKWALLDGYVNAALSRNIDVVHTFYGVPQWAASLTANCQTLATTVQCSGPPANPQDLYDYVTQVVTRYVGRIKYYELWNEPNNTKSWNGTVAAMATQSQAVYNIIKSIDPGALVITPGAATGADNPTQSGWMRMYLLDGGASFADVSSWHAYPKVFPTNTCPQTLDCAGSLLVSQASAMTSVLNSNGMAGKPVFVTEGGWGQDVALPDFTQEAAYVARWHILLASIGVNRAYWYAWGGTNWGTLFDPGLGIRPSGTAYQQVENWLTGATMTPCAAGSDGTWTCSIGRGNGYQALIVWNAAATVSFTGTTGFVQYRELSGNITALNGPVIIGSQPIILENMPSQ